MRVEEEEEGEEDDDKAKTQPVTVWTANCDIYLVNSRFLLNLARRKPRREKKGVWPRAPSDDATHSEKQAPT